MRILKEHRHLCPEEMVATLYSRARDFAGDSPQRDDITLVVAKV